MTVETLEHLNSLFSSIRQVANILNHLKTAKQRLADNDTSDPEFRYFIQLRDHGNDEYDLVCSIDLVDNLTGDCSAVFFDGLIQFYEQRLEMLQAKFNAY